jgi:hypothetical protein
MSRVIQDATAYREALARLIELDLGALRQQWRGLYKTQAPLNLSRELLVRAVAHRMRNSAGAASAQSRGASCSGLHSSSRRLERRGYALARS